MVRYAGGAQAERAARPPVGDRQRAGRRRRPGAGLGRAAPGSAPATTARGELRDVLAAPVPVVLDADGLTLLVDGSLAALLRAATRPSCVTPHDREFARLAGEAPGADRVDAAQRLAAGPGRRRPAQGGRARSSPTPDGRAYVEPDRHPGAGHRRHRRRAGRPARLPAGRRPGPPSGPRWPPRTCTGWPAGAAAAGRDRRRSRRRRARGRRPGRGSPLRRWGIGGVSSACAQAEVRRRPRRHPRTTWRGCGSGAGRRVMAVVKADGYGHGLLPGRPRGAGRRGRPGWASHRSTRRWRCARPASPRPLLAWLLDPGAAATTRVAADVDLSVARAWAARPSWSPRARAGGPAGAGRT